MMMDCTLKCIALTGIGPHIIEELKKGKPRTLELQSAHNLISLTVTSPGDVLLLTSVDLDDFTAGDRGGIIVQVISLTINMKSWLNMRRHIIMRNGRECRHGFRCDT